jgi:hypothetical protein
LIVVILSMDIVSVSSKHNPSLTLTPGQACRLTVPHAAVRVHVDRRAAGEEIIIAKSGVPFARLARDARWRGNM